MLDCANRPVGGLETKAIIMNRDDIDFDASVVDGTNNKLITTLICKADTAGFEIQGLKQLNNMLVEFVPSDEDVNKWRHNFNYRITNLTAEAREEIDKLGDGANLVIVVQKKWRGAANAHGFLVLGWGTGLELQEATEDSNQNSGAMVLRAASSELALEAEGPKVFFDTDYATSLTAFDNKFAGPTT